MIPYYDDINEFLASLPVSYRTNNPLFGCYRLMESKDGEVYKPPFKRGFYFVGLLTNAQKSKITYDNTRTNDLSSLIVFQSPGLIYSFHRDISTSGYLIYFKPQCFPYFRPALESEFPFFSIQHTDFYKLTNENFADLLPLFEDVFSAHEKSKDHTIASLKLLTLLYQLKELAIFNNVVQDKMANPQQILLKKFVTLVNTHYIEKKKVNDYAEILSVSSNHLSQTVKMVSGRNALSYINERLVREAKTLIHYTDLSIAEIAYRLDFSDPTNFGKFFKKHVGDTPIGFRKRR